MKNTLFVLSLISLSTFLAFSAAHDGANAQITQQVYEDSNLHGPKTPIQNWTSVQWGGDDTPYVNVKSAIDHEIASGKDLSIIQSSYDQQARSNPANKTAQFARDYCNRRCWWKGLSISKSEGKDSLEGLIACDPMNSYDFTRQRFISTVAYEKTQSSSDLRYLDSLGRRLLTRNPADVDVKWQLLEAMGYWKDRTKERLKLAQSWVEQYPSLPLAHLAYADSLWGIWSYNSTGNEEIGRKSIAEYQRFVSTAPSDNPLIKRADNLQKVMTGVMNGTIH